MNRDNKSPMHDHHYEINLLEYWHVIKRHRKMIAGVLAAVSIAAVVISLFLQKSYKAEALIIPVSSKGSGGGLSSLTSQFGGLASMAGISIPGGAASEAEKLVAILKSRTLAENVINTENLLPVLFEDAWDKMNNRWKTNDPEKQPDMERAVRSLKGAVAIMDDKKSKTIKITGIFRDPKVAARVVNAYLSELQKFINGNAFTMAKRNRIFIEGQLEENKEDLLEAGKEINEFYSGKRISSSDARVDVPIASASEPSIENAQQNAQQSAQRENLSAGFQASETESQMRNPVIGVAEASTSADPEIANLLTQKVDIEKRIAEAKTVKNVPQQVYLSYLMLRRELLAKVNALLTSQYEMAKIEESKEELSFQIIDKAVPPVKRFKPKRAQICMMAFMAALFAGVFIAFFREYINRMKQLHEGQG